MAHSARGTPDRRSTVRGGSGFRMQPTNTFSLRSNTGTLPSTTLDASSTVTQIESIVDDAAIEATSSSTPNRSNLIMTVWDKGGGLYGVVVHNPSWSHLRIVDDDEELKENRLRSAARAFPATQPTMNQALPSAMPNYFESDEEDYEDIDQLGIDFGRPTGKELDCIMAENPEPTGKYNYQSNAAPSFHSQPKNVPLAMRTVPSNSTMNNSSATYAPRMIYNTDMLAKRSLATAPPMTQGTTSGATSAGTGDNLALPLFDLSAAPSNNAFNVPTASAVQPKAPQKPVPPQRGRKKKSSFQPADELMNDMGDKFHYAKRKRTYPPLSHNYNTRSSKKVRVGGQDDDDAPFNSDEFRFDD